MLFLEFYFVINIHHFSYCSKSMKQLKRVLEDTSIKIEIRFVLKDLSIIWLFKRRQCFNPDFWVYKNLV